jgi:hypothetical protein
MDTESRNEAQGAPADDAQAMSLGDIIMGSQVQDEAMQFAVYKAAREYIDRMPDLSWADKGFLGALVGRLDPATGVVRDSHTWLAEWFNSSLGAIRKRREALAAAGYTVERQVKDEVNGGNLTSEIVLPVVAEAAMAVAREVAMSENGHRGCPKMDTPLCPKTGTKENLVSISKGKKKEEEEEESVPIEVVMSTSEVVSSGELVSVESDSLPVEALGEAITSLAPAVRAVLGNEVVRAEVARHLAAGVPPADLLGMLNRGWLAAQDKANPVAYMLEVLNTKAAASLAKAAHRAPTESSGPARAKRGKDGIALAVALPDGGTVYVEESGLRRLMAAFPGMSRDEARYLAQRAAEPYEQPRRIGQKRLRSERQLIEEAIALGRVDAPLANTYTGTMGEGEREAGNG